MSGEGTLPTSDHCFPAGGAISYLLPFPLHTPSEAFTRALNCTTSGFSPPCPLHIQQSDPRFGSSLSKGMMGKSQGSEKLPVGVDDIAAFTHDPCPLPPLCLITGTPRGKHRFFWATVSFQESLSFLLLPYIFVLYFREIKPTCCTRSFAMI